MRYLPILCLAQLAAFSLAGSAQTVAAKRQHQTTAKRGSETDASPVVLPTEPGEYAVIYTSMGNIVCRLLPKLAPKTVANFVGLARGSKTWIDSSTGKTMHAPLYSGTTFHRVIPGFMIQGGDPEGTGEGSPGYQFEDEIDPNQSFDKPGILAMANSGPNTNGSQFFITVAAATHLNGHYSIFGEVVSGQEVADTISQVPTNPENNKPLTPVKIIRIAIRTVHAPPAADKHG
ncbi:MAG TPA: peptidylprolyl isomerase [Bryobacteraceae bacterium]|nr:peptidylprolyl isomerase [Bryobacteraceae bacterium]